MTDVFTVEMLPAKHGDSLWIEYGDEMSPKRILIDGGPRGTDDTLEMRIKKLPKEERNFELIIVTHIDADHIYGTLKLLGDTQLGVRYEDIWFNGWKHLPGSKFEEFGPVQGEKLTTILDKAPEKWNRAFPKRAVAVYKNGRLPEKSLEGGLKLTILSPTHKDLEELRPVWLRECQKAGLDPLHMPVEPPEAPPGFEPLGPPDIEQLSRVPYTEDESEANASSIAILAEYDGKKLLFSGDATMETMERSIKKILKEQGDTKLKLDAFKLPHHGSQHNVNKEFLGLIDCKNYMISTNGDRYKHPDKEAISRLVKYGGPTKTLIFNYRTNHTAIWDDWLTKQNYNYFTEYPNGDNGVRLSF